MSFWEHLDDLRSVIFRSIFVIIGFMVIIFIGKNFVFDNIILTPLTSEFALYQAINKLFLFFADQTNGKLSIPTIEEFSVELINIELASQFFIHIKMSFYLAFVLAVPYILFLLWRFLAPALYTNEKKAIKASFGVGGLLFYLGVGIGYFLVLPLTIKFLGSYQVSEAVPNQISLSSYISMFVRLVLLMGIVFEMPALAAVLSRLGIVTRELLRKYRKYAVVALLILAAVITPSGDAFTLCLVAIPLYLLYELSILVCKKS